MLCESEMPTADRGPARQLARVLLRLAHACAAQWCLQERNILWIPGDGEAGSLARANSRRKQPVIAHHDTWSHGQMDRGRSDARWFFREI